jgi:glycosyltransferase involved in cell wall biosynthesis
MKDEVTIVVPCKNEESYIYYLLDSLKKQKGMEGIRILIADCSTDNTRRVIENHKDWLDIEVIEGGPVSVAKNNGAYLVTTPYILFIDADVRFFSNTVIYDTLKQMKVEDLHLIGLNIKCYDTDLRAQLSFSIFNVLNKILSKWIPFAVGAYLLTRKDKFYEHGKFPCKYPTSEDFHLSRKYDPKKFKIAKHYFGQDSRRFKKMGYLGMSIYLIKNFLFRDNYKHWDSIDERRYWS